MATPFRVRGADRNRKPKPKNQHQGPNTETENRKPAETEMVTPEPARALCIQDIVIDVRVGGCGFIDFAWLYAVS